MPIEESQKGSSDTSNCCPHYSVYYQATDCHLMRVMFQMAKVNYSAGESPLFSWI
jgi:hypothetical protein